MSPADPASEPAQALRRGLAVRIAVALAVLAVLAALAVLAVIAPSGLESEPPAPVAKSGETPPLASVPSVPESATASPSEAPAPGATDPAGASSSPKPEAASATRAGEEMDAVPDSPHSSQPPAAPLGAEESNDASRSEAAGQPLAAASADGAKPARDSRVEGADAGRSAADAEGSGQSTATAKGEREQPLWAATRNKPVRGPRLQAGVFLQAADAEAFKARLEAEGFPVYIESRVYVGPFRDRKEAERAREVLQTMGLSSVLIGQ